MKEQRKAAFLFAKKSYLSIWTNKIYHYLFCLEGFNEGASFYLIIFIIIVVICSGSYGKSCQPIYPESPIEDEITKDIPKDKLITLYIVLLIK